MSATTETLLEEIASLKARIAASPDDNAELIIALATLERSLVKASKALNEGKQLLKD